MRKRHYVGIVLLTTLAVVSTFGCGRSNGLKESQTSAVSKNEGQSVTAKAPAMEAEGSVTESEVSVTESEGSVTESEVSVTESKELATESEAPAAKKELIRTEKPEFTANEVRRVAIAVGGQDVFEITYAPQDYKSNFAYWDIITPYQSLVMVDTEEMFNLYNALAAWKFGSAIEIKEGEDTGLSEPSASIAIDYYDIKSEADTADADPNTTCLIKFGKKDEQGNYYAQIEGFETIYKISSSAADPVLMVNPYDYILKICCLVDYKTVDTVEINMGESTHVIDVNAVQKKYAFDKKEVDEKAFSTLYQALMGIIVKGEPEGENASEGKEESPVLQIDFQRNMENAPDITVAFKTYNDDYYLAEINGNQFFIVSKEDVDQLAKQVEESF